MMFFYEGSELIGFLFKTIRIVFISGIMTIPFVPARIKPVSSVSLILLIALFNSIFAVRGFKPEGIAFFLVIFFGTFLNFWQ
jgi:hypothetical protein